MRYKRYPKYKDSGIEWLGEIPEKWEISPLKRIFKIVNGGTPSSLKESYWDGEIVWVTPNDLSKLTDVYIRDSERKITQDGFYNCSAGKVPVNSIVLSTRAPIGYIAIAGLNMCTNQGCKSLIAIKIIKHKYFYYWMHSVVFYLNVLGQGATFTELSNKDLSMVDLLLPSIREQNAIADFLDYKTSQIDSLISDKQKLIELLEEKCSALITQVVTKGLDPNVSMRDSGIEWIGEIPEKWATTLLKRRFDVQLGKMLQSQALGPQDTLEPYLCAANIQWKRTDLSTIKYMWLSPADKNKYFLREGDLLVSEGGDVGRSCIWRAELPRIYFQNAINRIRSKGVDLITFLHYWIYFVKYIGYIDVLCNKATIPHFTADKVQNLTILLPTPTEQLQITAFLDHKTSQIDSLVSDIQQSITLLEEYKQSLITAAVTGKIDVRKERSEEIA